MALSVFLLCQLAVKRSWSAAFIKAVAALPRSDAARANCSVVAIRPSTAARYRSKGSSIAFRKR